jgi:hypothetical protein
MKRLLGPSLAATLSGCGFGGPPSDAAMIAHLQAERAAFDTLVRMLREDRVSGRLAIDALPGRSPEHAARRRTYRDLFRRTGCRWIIRNPAGPVWFDVHYPTSGGGVAGTGFKGYVHAPLAPAPLRESLDHGGLVRFEDTFRHIGGDWYLSRTRI